MRQNKKDRHRKVLAFFAERKPEKSVRVCFFHIVCAAAWITMLRLWQVSGITRSIDFQSTVLRLQVVAKAPDGDNLNIGTDAGEPFAQDRHIDLHMILHSIGFQSPDIGDDRRLG